MLIRVSTHRLSCVIVFATPVADIAELKARRKDAVYTVIDDVLKNNWQKLEHRFDILRATNGAYAES
ncbi:hypothetical protein AVEN_119554-1 [Araneus ventricosus]|uniref:Uncharacterized protein n=1 Tax=Araneus ventricosus TaxID=182803 RepID=A0A4Y2IMK6_ARAVE|nr:hypothetical protein AVEN_119554-1 [Araneus ventricosus]